MIANSITYVTGIREHTHGLRNCEPMKVKIITRYSCGGYPPAVWESMAYSNGKRICYLVGGYSNDSSIDDVVQTFDFRVLTQHTEYLSHIRW
ncbi:hypothetical protein VPHD518_0092 [Vibrio phage D518]